MSKKSVLKKLEEAGWHIYIYDNCFQWFETNRFVDIDGDFVDVYTYADEEKYKGYLEVNDFLLFAKYLKIIKKERKSVDK